MKARGYFGDTIVWRFADMSGIFSSRSGLREVLRAVRCDERGGFDDTVRRVFGGGRYEPRADVWQDGSLRGVVFYDYDGRLAARLEVFGKGYKMEVIG